MNKEYKKMWLESLRRGDEQRRFLLCDSRGSQCALGKLCNLMPGNEWTSIDYRHGGLKMISSRGETSRLSKLTMEETSISQDQCVLVMIMNDHKQMNFAEIADWIEGNL